MANENPTVATASDKPNTNLAGAQANPEEDPRQGLPANVQVENATTPFPVDTKKQVDPEGKYIKYIGPALIRVMDQASWKAGGVDCETEYQWNSFNHKRLPMSAFNDAQLQYLLRVDDRFKLVLVDKDGKEVQDTTE